MPEDSGSKTTGGPPPLRIKRVLQEILKFYNNLNLEATLINKNSKSKIKNKIKIQLFTEKLQTKTTFV